MLTNFWLEQITDRFNSAPKPPTEGFPGEDVLFNSPVEMAKSSLIRKWDKYLKDIPHTPAGIHHRRQLAQLLENQKNYNTTATNNALGVLADPVLLQLTADVYGPKSHLYDMLSVQANRSITDEIYGLDGGEVVSVASRPHTRGIHSSPITLEPLMDSLVRGIDSTQEFCASISSGIRDFFVRDVISAISGSTTFRTALPPTTGNLELIDNIVSMCHRIRESCSHDVTWMYMSGDQYNALWSTGHFGISYYTQFLTNTDKIVKVPSFKLEGVEDPVVLLLDSNADVGQGITMGYKGGNFDSDIVLGIFMPFILSGPILDPDSFVPQYQFFRRSAIRQITDLFRGYYGVIRIES